MPELEEELLEGLSKVLLDEQEVDGLDEDLVAHISGMLSAKIHEDEGNHDMTELFEEILNPFLESVHCPDHLIEQAQSAVQTVVNELHHHVVAIASTSNTTRKLTQGIVSMSSELEKSKKEHEEDANRFLWGTDSGVKAMANELIDAHTDKSSAKEKRKARKAEAEQARKLLSSQNDHDVDGADDESGTLVRMNYRTITGNSSIDKARDVQVRNVTLSLDNGTILLESGELKFAYQRRYGLIGENGVGKSTLLKAIAREDGIEGFPQHLRVLHVRQVCTSQSLSLGSFHVLFCQKKSRCMPHILCFLQFLVHYRRSQLIYRMI